MPFTLRRRRVLGGKPKGLVLIDRTLGTNIGDMTENGGVAASFDGVTSQAGAACSRRSSNIQGFVGKTLVSPKIFGRAVFHGSNNAGFANSGGSVTLEIYGKNGTAPVGAADGTLLGSISITEGADESAGRAITSTDLSTRWDHLWGRVATAAAITKFSAELVLYEWA